MNNQTVPYGSNSSYRARGRWYAGRAKKLDKYPKLGQVTHVDGSLWDVRDVRLTKHGFDLYFGSPVDTHGIYNGGLPKLIDTKALYDFWDAHRTKGHGFLFDLPAGRTTLKRARKRMGFNYNNDVDDFWLDRIDDLDQMKPRDFAAKHGVSVPLTFEWRHRLLGNRPRRPLGWWRTPETIALLLSNLTLRKKGEKLGIKTSQVGRLRVRARLEQAAAAETISQES